MANILELCRNGHERTDENTYIVPSTGKRQCQECRKHPENMEKARKRNREYRREHRKEERAYKLKIRYGIELSELENASCAICGTTENICVDHDHETLKFRGFLCRTCNGGIGLLGDDLESVRRALTYMEKHYGY